MFANLIVKYLLKKRKQKSNNTKLHAVHIQQKKANDESIPPSVFINYSFYYSVFSSSIEENPSKANYKSYLGKHEISMALL